MAEVIEARKKKGRSFSIVACAEGAVAADEAVLDEETKRHNRENSLYPTVSYAIAAKLEELTGQEPRTMPCCCRWLRRAMRGFQNPWILYRMMGLWW